MDPLLTTREVAERLRLSPNTVKKLWREGRLKGYRLSERKLRFRPKDVEEYLEASEAPPPAEPTRQYGDEEHEWMYENREFLKTLAGQWIMLDGPRLVSHSPDALEAYEEAKRQGVKVPFVFYMESLPPGAVLFGL